MKLPTAAKRKFVSLGGVTERMFAEAETAREQGWTTQLNSNQCSTQSNADSALAHAQASALANIFFVTRPVFEHIRN